MFSILSQSSIKAMF
ncbi:hypothetical protein AB0U55_16430 [Escherichia coli]